MTSTRIEWSFNKIQRLSGLDDLAAMRFPGNRNQQHAFLVLWLALKYSEHRMVPNFGEDRTGRGEASAVLRLVAID